MTIPPQFLDEIRARVPLADVVGRSVRLTRRGREHVGLCPFHKEKTPSFTVVEDKGFFHCFGCGAHGSVIDWVMRTENLAFPEAVERLAGLAGLEMPRQTPEDQERARRAATLHDVLETACRWFESELAGTGGADARAYLRDRGLKRGTVERFRLGLAPDGRDRLIRHLKDKDIKPELIGQAGLLTGGDDGRDAIDKFRHRLMFPITDRGGRVVAFGGRALGDHPAKYMNSPETALFHKGRMLYGFAQARKAAHEAGTVIVAEGYMDVIALAQAGFEHAVAPLGTALTESQLMLLWKLADEPVLCFDGDAAGLRAAMRAVDRALPMLEPGRSLRFALLPPGEDPDSLIQARGPGAMAQVETGAVPLIEMLWRAQCEGRRVDTPEKRAGLERDLNQAVARIGNQNVQFHYRNAIREKLRAAFRPARGGARRQEAGRSRRRYDARPGLPQGTGMAEIKPSDPLGAGAKGVNLRAERLLVGLPLVHPPLIERVADRMMEIHLETPGFDEVRRALLDVAATHETLDSEVIHRHLSDQGLVDVVNRIAGERGARLTSPLACFETVDEAERLWQHTFDLHQQQHWDAELAADVAAFADNPSDETWQRLKARQEHKQATEARVTEIDPALASAGERS